MSHSEPSAAHARSAAGGFARAAALGGAAAAVPFVGTLWDWTLHPTRTALASRLFSDFYDVQARALLDGHLDVPRGSIGFEAFRVGGRDYLYFPPFPSVLRTPLLVLTDGLDGDLTAVSMLAGWVVAMVMTALLLWRVRRLLLPEGVVGPMGRWEAWAVGLTVLAVGGGSALVFLAGLPWVYHEAYVWSTALSIGAAWAVIGVLERPGRGRSAVAGGFVLASTLTRSTQGLAWCAALLGAAALLAVWPTRRAGAGRWVPVALAGAVPLAVGVAVNWAKFRHPFLIPLGDQLVADASPNRRAALAANGGSLFGPQYVPTNLLAYLRPDGLRLTSVFPYVTFPGRPPRVLGDAVFDEVYRTGSVPATMPALTVLSLGGVAGLAAGRARPVGATLLIPAAATVAAPLAVVCFGYLAPRYVAEALPALVVLGAVGLFELVGALGRNPARTGWRRAAMAALAILTAFGVVANTATGLLSARTERRGDALADVLELRATVAGWTGADDQVDRVASIADAAPAAERVAVVGDCRATYLATGNRYQPWMPIDASPVGLVVDVEALARAGTTSLATFAGPGERVLAVEVAGDGRSRLVLDGSVTPWSAAGQQRVTITPDPVALTYAIASADGALDATVPMLEWDDRWISRPIELVVEPTAGVDVRWGRSARPC